MTFGLPPLQHSDDPARAVKCGLLIRDQVRPMRLKANIGIATGKVFIGYVGASVRGEYTEYGVWVNMALAEEAAPQTPVSWGTGARESRDDPLSA